MGGMSREGGERVEGLEWERDNRGRKSINAKKGEQSVLGGWRLEEAYDQKKPYLEPSERSRKMSRR
jgi:hypothetical protein